MPDFSKQTKRGPLLVKDPDILAYVDEANHKERQFGYPSEPQEESKYQKVLIQGRLQINPSVLAVKPKLSLGIPKFDKMKRREMTFLK